MAVETVRVLIKHRRYATQVAELAKRKLWADPRETIEGRVIKGFITDRFKAGPLEINRTPPKHLANRNDLVYSSELTRRDFFTVSLTDERGQTKAKLIRRPIKRGWWMTLEVVSPLPEDVPARLRRRDKNKMIRTALDELHTALTRP